MYYLGIFQRKSSAGYIFFSKGTTLELARIFQKCQNYKNFDLIFEGTAYNSVFASYKVSRIVSPELLS